MSENTLSMLDDDKTLPIEFDGSCDPGQLPEVTFSAGVPLPDGSTSDTTTEGGGGYISPVRARTMKEYDQQLAELKKENFSLKLRIYFLEERIQKQCSGDGEALFKTTDPQNIELKVEVESLKKELCEKQDLLKKASTALESVTTQHEMDLKQVREFARQEALKEAQQQREILELEHVQLQEQLLQKDQDITQLKMELEETRQKVKELLNIKRHLEAEVKVSQRRRRELETELDCGLLDDADGKGLNKALDSNLEDKDRFIKQLQNVVKTKELIIEQLEEEKKEAVKEISNVLEAEIRKRDEELEALRREAHPEQTSHAAGSPIADSEIDLRSEAGILTDELEKPEMAMKAEGDRGTDVKSLEDRLTELEQVHQKCEENILKRNKVIQGLAKVLYERDAEILSLSSQLEELTRELEKMKDDFHQEKVHEYQELESHHAELLTRDDRITELEAAMRENDVEKQRLEKSISRREAEVRQLTEQLDKADAVISQKDDVLQDLRLALQQEKQKHFAVADSLEKHYQTLLDDQQRQIESQEKMLQRMTKSLQDKDKQLEDMLLAQTAVGDKTSKDVLIDSLKAQLADKDKELEEHISKHYKGLDAKDAEIRQLKMALKERDHDIAKANQMLLVTEETIDSLESETRDKNAIIKQLAVALKAQERALEEAAESHELALAEKNALLEKLQKSLSAREKHLQNAIGASSSSTNALVQQLQTQLQEKDKALHELISEHGRATDAHDKTVQELLHKLRMKDNQIKDVEQAHQDELGQLSHEIQTLQADIKKRDFLIQTLEGNASWMESQQREMLDKLRTALNEKDRTIEALVESGREKDALFRKLQESFVVTRGITDNTDQTARAQELKDQTTLLSRDLLSKDALITRLKSEVDRLNAKSDQMTNVVPQDLQVNQVRMKELMAAGDTTCLRCKQLQSQVDELRLQLDRYVFPQRTQTLGGSSPQRVNRELRYSILEPNDPITAQGLQSEIQTDVSTDRQYPNNGVELNVSRLQQHVLMLQKQLEDSHQWNSQLQHHLQQAAANNNNNSSNNNKQPGEADRTQTGAMGIGQVQVGGAKDRSDGVNHNTSAAGVQPESPFELSDGRPLRQQSCNGSLMLWNSYLPSFMDLPDLSFDEELLSEMTAEELQQLVRSLKKQLADVLRMSNGTAAQTPSGAGQSNGSPAWILQGLRPDGASAVPEKLPQQVHNDLEKENAELKMLRSKDSATAAELQKQVSKLSVQLQHAEYLNELLKKQLELNAEATRSSSNPQLITNMADEIDRLKEQVATAQSAANTDSSSTEQNASQMPCCDSGKSTLPGVDIKAIEKQMDALKTELVNAKKQNIQLQAVLASTEATVRSQAEKIKGYRRQLEEAGLLVKSPIRSHSESNLTILSGHRSPLKHARSVGELSGASLPGVDLTKICGYGQGQDVDKLKKEIAELKNCVIRYDRAMKSGPRSVSAGSSDSSNDSMKRSLMSHIPIATTRLRTISASSSSTTHSTTAMPSSAAAQQLQKLEQDVEDLKSQLAESEKTNSKLVQKVEQLKQKASTRSASETCDSATQTLKDGIDFEEKLQTLEEDYSVSKQSLTKQLAESRQLCESLQHRLDELSSFLEEFLHQNDDGEVDMIDVTPNRVTNFKTLLNDTRHLASDLSVMMESASEDSLAGDSPTHTATGGVAFNAALQKKYELAQREVAQLREQLDQYSQRNSSSTDKLSQLQADNGQLRTSLAQAEQNSAKLEVRLEQLQNDLFTEREKYSVVDEDWQSVKSELSNVKKSHQLLEAQLCEAHQLRAGLEKTIADLRSEREMSLKKIEADKMKMEELQRQVESLRSQLKVSNAREKSPELGSTRAQNGSQLSMEDILADLPKRPSLHKAPRHNVSIESVERRRHGTNEMGSYQHKNISVSSYDGTRDMLTTCDLLDENLLRRAGLEPQNSDLHMSHYHEKTGTRDSSSPGASVLGNGSTHHMLERLENDISHDALPPNVDPQGRQVVDPLRMQLEIAEELNSTIQSIYRHVSDHETSLSVGVQNSPSVGSKSSQTQPGAAESCPLDLTSHITEVRQLRIKLEEAITRNNRLREMLEKHLTTARKEGREAYLKVQQDLQAEIDSTNKQLQARTRQLNNITQELVAKDSSLKEANQKVTELQAVIKDRENELKVLRKTVERLEANVLRLREELKENADLNKTLKRELNIYDALTPKQAPGKGRHPPARCELDVSLLMEEMRELRKQLERTIDNNNMLREKLEQVVAQQLADSQMKHSIDHKYVNETAASSCSIKLDATRVTNGSLSPRDVAVERSQLPGNGLQNQSMNSSQSSGSDMMRYNITDPCRPPSKLDKALETNREVLADITGAHPPQSKNTGVTTVRVGSDLRCLYAVGAIDDYELLKKQLSEVKPIISNVQALLTAAVSLDGSTRRQLSSHLHNLQSLASKQERLISMFWLTQLPRKYEHGESLDADLVEQNHQLRQQIAVLRKNYVKAKEIGLSVAHKLAAEKKLRENTEEKIILQLTKTHAVLKKARSNLAENLTAPDNPAQDSDCIQSVDTMENC